MTIKTDCFSKIARSYQGGRVVKALDLSSNVRMHTWVRTPFLVVGPCLADSFLLLLFFFFLSCFFTFLLPPSPRLLFVFYLILSFLSSMGMGLVMVALCGFYGYCAKNKPRGVLLIESTPILNKNYGEL